MGQNGADNPLPAHLASGQPARVVRTRPAGNAQYQRPRTTHGLTMTKKDRVKPADDVAASAPRCPFRVFT